MWVSPMLEDEQEDEEWVQLIKETKKEAENAEELC
jgi:hypothetical protein